MYLCIVTLYHVHSSSSSVKKHPPSMSLFLLSQECHYSAGVVSLKKFKTIAVCHLNRPKTKYHIQDLLTRNYTPTYQMIDQCNRNVGRGGEGFSVTGWTLEEAI